MGFAHIGSEIWYVSDDQFLDCGPHEKKDCSASNHWLSLKDHFVYLNNTISGLC
jgi:hypothetical protein